MSLVWQIIRKDIQRQRWWLALFIATGLVTILTGTATMVALHGRSFKGEVVMGGERLGLVALIVMGAVTFFLPALAVLDDSLVDPAAAWRTRPISIGRLLAAKCIFIVGTLVVIPVVALALLHPLLSPLARLRFMHYVGIAEIMLALGMLSAGAAACARTLVQCLPALPVGWFLFAVWLAGAVRMDFRYGQITGTTAVAIIGLMASALATAGVFNQYLTRRTAVTLVLLLVGSLGPVALSAFAQWLPFG